MQSTDIGGNVHALDVPGQLGEAVSGYELEQAIRSTTELIGQTEGATRVRLKYHLTDLLAAQLRLVSPSPVTP